MDVTNWNILECVRYERYQFSLTSGTGGWMNVGNDDTEDSLTRTGVLKKEFGPYWHVWLWLRHQFSPTSLGAIGLILVVGGGYIEHLNGRVNEQNTHITILETKVVPIIEVSGKLTELATAMSGLTGKVTTTLEEHDRRIKRIEDNIDLDYNEKMEREKREQKRARK